MFIGHYNPRLAFHKQEQGSKTTFFVLVPETQLVDLLWDLFALHDIEGGNPGGIVEHNFFRNSKKFGLINQNRFWGI